MLKYKFNHVLSLVKTFKYRFKQCALTKWVAVKQHINAPDIAWTVFYWLGESIIEGSILNFVLWQLTGFDWTLLRSLALGFGIKEIIDIIDRLRKNGSTK